jgi:hypothetical protein
MFHLYIAVIFLKSKPDKMAARNDRPTLLKLAFRVGRAFQPDKMAARNDRPTLLKLAFRVGRAFQPDMSGQE